MQNPRNWRLKKKPLIAQFSNLICWLTMTNCTRDGEHPLNYANTSPSRSSFITADSQHNLSGLDEAKGQIYFKYSVSALSNELTRLVFDWTPRVNVWEHVCFMKKPDKEGESNQLKFFVNGENKGKGKKETHKINQCFFSKTGRDEGLYSTNVHCYGHPNVIFPFGILIFCEEFFSDIGQKSRQNWGPSSILLKCRDGKRIIRFFGLSPPVSSLVLADSFIVVANSSFAECKHLFLIWRRFQHSDRALRSHRAIAKCMTHIWPFLCIALCRLDQKCSLYTMRWSTTRTTVFLSACLRSLTLDSLCITKYGKCLWSNRCYDNLSVNQHGW